MCWLHVCLHACIVGASLAGRQILHDTVGGCSDVLLHACPVCLHFVQVSANLCPYSALGVQANASDKEIKSAYRQLVLQVGTCSRYHSFPRQRGAHRDPLHVCCRINLGSSCTFTASILPGSCHACAHSCPAAALIWCIDFGVLQYHPDVNSGQSSKFMTIQQAYELLTGRSRQDPNGNTSRRSDQAFHDW